MTISPGAVTLTQAQLDEDYTIDVNDGPRRAQARLSTLAVPGAAPAGTFTANEGNAVAVANANITASSLVVITLKTVGGTPAGHPFLSAITAGVGFEVKSFTGDTSVYNYIILK